MRKRAGGQPWLTAFDLRRLALAVVQRAAAAATTSAPPIMSHEFQNSSVFDWYATSRSGARDLAAS